MHRFLRFLALAVAVVAAFWVLRTYVLAPDPLLVTVVEVENGRVEQTVTNSRAGTVKARRRARLSPEVGGRVVEVPFREGDRVAAGDLLVRLDDALPQAQLEVARRELAAARARADEACLAARLAERDLDRNRGLAADGIVSSDWLDRLESTAQSTAAGCEAARRTADRSRASVSLAEADLQRTRLTAPFAAVVAELEVEVGEWATPSPAAMPVPAVLDLIDPASIYVSAPMDEVDSSRLRVGQEVYVTLDPYPDQRFQGRLVRVAPYVLDLEQQNRTVEIEVQLADSELSGTLLPGTSADVEVLLEAREDVLRLPTATVIEGERVLVLEAGRIVERPVEVGLRNWDFTEIVGGLSLGELVIDSLDRAEVEAGVEARLEPTEPTS